MKPSQTVDGAVSRFGAVSSEPYCLRPDDEGHQHLISANGVIANGRGFGFSETGGGGRSV